MKSKQLIIFIFCIVVALGAINIVKSHIRLEKGNVANSEKGVAVVELFTSEGCSSCPSADALLSKLKNDNANNIFLLAFHVDYWNYLGWNDRFSSPAYSQRQKNYCDQLHSDVYTPQMVLNGSTQFVGSDENAARKAINESLNDSAQLAISLKSSFTVTERRDSPIYVWAWYKIKGDLRNEVLNVALVQKSAQSSVSKGENSGRHLSHVNVVRGFQTMALKSDTGEFTFTLPGDIQPENVMLVAYSQLSTSLKVTGAIGKMLVPDRDWSPAIK